MGERVYKDILEPRRADSSTFLWASRTINPQLAYKQETSATPQYHKEEVVKCAKIQDLLTTLSHQQNVSKEDLEQQIVKILDEIGYNKKLKLIRWLGIVLVKICSRTCTSIFVNEEKIVQLKSQMGVCPVIFVPSHRSYADFILMSLMCFSEDLAIPAIAAGMDFHGMWAMGTMLRDTGAFFMRRSYNDDSLYWTTFKQYIYQIVTKGELPIEFFIEGTRSRSNKSLTPKYGLILMVLKAFFLSQVPDILFVPINISYDRILEEKLFAFELLGIPKPKETTSGFFKSLSIMKEKYGSIYFNFGTPISTKAFFGSSLDRSRHSLQPVYQQEITNDEKKLIPALAYEIIYQQQKQCTITAFNLVAMALCSNLTSNATPLNIDNLISEVLWLRKVTVRLGGFVHIDDPKSSILAALEVHKNIAKFNESGELTLVFDRIVLDKLNTNRLKAYDLSSQTLTFSVPFIMLQIYINPVLHYFVDVAVLAVILRHRITLSRDDLFQDYRFLRGLLSQEFVTFNRREKIINHYLILGVSKSLDSAMEMELLCKDDNECYSLSNNKKLENLLYNCVDNFIFTYFIVSSHLSQTLTHNISEKSILVNVQAEIESRMNEKTVFIHPYSLSLDTITNCLNALSDQRILCKRRQKGITTYDIDKIEVVSLLNRLVSFIGPTEEAREKLKYMHLHLKPKL